MYYKLNIEYLCMYLSYMCVDNSNKTETTRVPFKFKLMQ